MGLGIKKAVCVLLGVCLITSSASKTTFATAENLLDEGRPSKISVSDVAAGAAEVRDLSELLDSDTVPEAVGMDKALENVHIERLYEEEGSSLNNVIFKNADGTNTLYQFDYPVKYVSETGEIKDINLDIAEDGEKSGSYKSSDNSIQVNFPSKLSDGISLNDSEISVTLIPIASNSSSVSYQPSLSPSAALIGSKTVSYAYDNNTSYEYSLTYTGFKEDIVVSEYTGQTEYEFTLLTGGLSLTEKHGSYYLTDEDGNIKANIGDIIIFTADERNNAFGSMTYETVRENREYRMTIHIDADYLLDEATVYPIRIDPTIEINYSTKGAGAIEDVTINSLDGSEGSSATVWVGKREKYGISRILMRFPSLSLSSIVSADKITNASVEIRDLMCEGTAMTVYCYAFTGNTWNESTAEWSNVNPNSYGALLSSNSISYSNGAGKSPIHRYSFNITAAVKGWKTGDYSQGKGIIFKASSSVENGSTYISKTIASYNRAEYRPTLSVTYTTNSTQVVADGTYCLNNVNTGKYLRYVTSSSGVSGISDIASHLKDTDQWQIRGVDGGYVIRSANDITKYLGVPMNSENKVVIVNVGSTATIPPHCKWNITFSPAGGCFIKSAYNSKYLYSLGTSMYTSTDTGTYGSSTYDSRSWRIATKSNIKEKELPASADINTLILNVGGTGKATVNSSNALWATYKDFNYSLYSSGYVTLSSSVFTGKKNGVTVVKATHKPTNNVYIFAVIVGKQPSAYIKNYVDEGYQVRFDGGMGDVIEYTQTVGNKFQSIFGLKTTVTYSPYTSKADICKMLMDSNVTFSNLAKPCLHFPTHLTRSDLLTALGSGEPKNLKVMWTGHILNGNPPSVTFPDSYYSLNTPCMTTTGSEYTNKSDYDVRRESLHTDMHEISHLLGAPDHYCNQTDSSPCSNPHCYIHVDGRPKEDKPKCIMQDRIPNLDTYDETEIYCSSCLKTISEHLTQNNQ